MLKPKVLQALRLAISILCPNIQVNMAVTSFGFCTCLFYVWGSCKSTLAFLSHVTVAKQIVIFSEQLYYAVDAVNDDDVPLL